MAAPAQRQTCACAGCGGTTKRVDAITVRALVLPRLHEHLETEGAFRFCPERGCALVYTHEQPGFEIVADDLAVEVFQKTDNPDRPVCYCFGYSVRDIEKDARMANGSRIVDDIEAKCREGLDRCETENPQGRCCLGNVRSLVNTTKAPALAMPDPPRAHDCCSAKQASEPLQTNAPLTAPRHEHRAGRLAAVGAVLAAVLSSACCWLPLALIGLGLSAGGIGTFFEAYRVVFLGATSVLLGAGVYLVYFRKPACKPGDACAVPNPKLIRFNKVMLWVAAAFIAAFAFFPNYVGYLLGGDDAVASAGASEATEATTAAGKLAASPVTRTFAIEGMSCESCTVHVREALAVVPGVAVVEVSYEEKVARITFAQGVEADEAAILAAIDDLGFEARLK